MVLGDFFRKVYCFRLRGYHPLWRELSRTLLLTTYFVTFQRDGTHATKSPTTPSAPTRTGLKRRQFGLLPVRSPLLRQSLVYFLFLRLLRWFSSPRMLHTPMNSVHDTPKGWVVPFGNLRINVCLPLPEAYRSLPRPSSPVNAKASAVYP